ncbi:uncharacterized protein EV154DRAFT_487716 [Mucor mucedo]|uniref:uncharacterized protein n=1 Tax=Mucor mucedo TaxID=29922 RepID=UPI002220A08B|nr:uncharacterized protein EV154DRAFT_487716 [Mucor mucedo]KAI7871100.1 hypothetical protein EV154DRAFT_487716 [Mucor mucedo]
MTKTKFIARARGNAPASSSKAWDVLKPFSNGTSFKTTVATQRPSFCVQTSWPRLRLANSSRHLRFSQLLYSEPSQESEIANGKDIPSSFDNSWLSHVKPNLPCDIHLLFSHPEFDLDMQKQLREQN